MHHAGGSRSASNTAGPPRPPRPPQKKYSFELVQNGGLFVEGDFMRYRRIAQPLCACTCKEELRIEVVLPLSPATMARCSRLLNFKGKKPTDHCGPWIRPDKTRPGSQWGRKTWTSKICGSFRDSLLRCAVKKISPPHLLRRMHRSKAGPRARKSE